MKQVSRKIFSPVLKVFESGEGAYSYKKSSRTILLVVGCLFLFLSVASALAGISSSQLGALIPAFVFLVVGSTCLIVGALGSDRAVSKIWGGK